MSRRPTGPAEVRMSIADYSGGDAATLRTPPHSLEAEQSVLGGLLLDNGAWGRAGGVLTDSDFYNFQHRLIFSAIGALVNAAKPADVITVFEQLKGIGKADECGGLVYLNSLAQSVPSAANIRRYAEIVREHATLRKLVAATDEIAASAFNPHGLNLAEILEKAQSAVGAVVASSSHAPATRARTLDLHQLAQHKAPSRHWFLPQWLSSGPTLFAAGGGLGKSLLMQQGATAMAVRRPFISDIEHACRSLIWACEDDDDELWRRQEDISRHFGIELDEPADNLVIQSRRGVDNLLMVPARSGELHRTNVFDELRQQVNDLAIDVAWLDNVAHLFGGDEVSRGQVTAFLNAMAGLVTGRPFGVVLLAHTARQAGSEFAGSAAWENAVRMRWYLGTKLPDQRVDDAEEEGADVRFLCKRKANYSARDYVRFTMHDGVLVPDQVASQSGALSSRLDEKRAEEILLAGFKSLRAMGIVPSHAKNSPDYLPREVAAKGLGAGYSASELAKALNRLMGRGAFVVGIAGQYANRNPKQGLVLQTEGVS